MQALRSQFRISVALVWTFVLTAPGSLRAVESTLKGIEGNWIATFENSPTVPQARVSIWPSHVEGHPDRVWLFAMVNPDDSRIGQNLKFATISHNTVIWDNSYRWHNTDFKMVIVSLSDEDENEMTGTWENYQNEKGRVVFQRAIPRITKVAVWSQFGSTPYDRAASARDRSVVYGKGPLVVEFDYSEAKWSMRNNRMRGNRPDIKLRLYGENLWGMSRSTLEGHPNFEFQLPDRFDDTYVTRLVDEAGVQIGRQIQIHLWDGIKPGRYDINVNGVIVPIDLVLHGFPGPAPVEFHLVDRQGQTLPELAEGQIFALEARFDESNDAEREIKVTFGSRRILDKLMLFRQDDRRLFRSRWYRLVEPSVDYAAMTDADYEEFAKGQISPEAAEVLGTRYPGDWLVRISNETGTVAQLGRLTIAPDGTGADLLLGSGDETRPFTLFDASAEVLSDETQPSHLIARFRSDADAQTYPEAPGVTNFSYARAHGDLVLLCKELSLEVPLRWAGEAPRNDILVFSFIRPEATWLQGEWDSREGMGPVGAKGVGLWTRGPPRIREVVVLADQTSPDGAFAYPGGEETDAPTTTNRRLMILGENLPARQGTMTQPGTIPGTGDPLVHYGDFAIDDQTRELLLQQAFDVQGRERPTDPDQLIVRAEFDRDVKAGTKSLFLGPAVGDWPLQFNDDFPDLRFTRDRNFTKADEIAVFLPDETAFVTLDLDFVYHLQDTQKVPLALIGISPESKMKFLGRVIATRVTDESKPTFRTKGLTWVKPSEDHPTILEAADEYLVSVAPGWRVAVRSIDQAITAEPAVVTVQRPDDEVGKVWLEALERVARCPGVKGNIDQPREFAMERGEVFHKGIWVSRLLSGDRGNNDIQLLNGDHAAALLIRDEFVRQMKTLLPQYAAQAHDPQAVIKFWMHAQKSPGAARDPFWRNNVVYGIRFPGGLPLAEVLNLEFLAEERLGGVSHIEATAWALDEVTSALKKRVNSMVKALDRAERAGDTNLDEIMVFAGYSAPDLIRAITAKLVMEKDGRWVPDDQAIRFVKGLYVPGRAMRALEGYSDIDNTFNAIAVAVITAGTSAAVSGSGYATAAAYTSFLGNVVDASIGLYGVKEYYDGEKRFDTAMGSAPLVGAEAVDDAAALRKSLLGTVAGVLLPGGMAAWEGRGLAGIGQAGRGRGLVMETRGRDLDIDSLKPSAREDLLAYYDELLTRRYQGGLWKDAPPPLSPEELEIFNDLNRQFRQRATAGPASEVAESIDNLPGAGRGPTPEVVELDPNKTIRQPPPPSPDELTAPTRIENPGEMPSFSGTVVDLPPKNPTPSVAESGAVGGVSTETLPPTPGASRSPSTTRSPPAEPSVNPGGEKPISEMTPAERQAYHDQKATAETSEKFRGGVEPEDGGDGLLPGPVTEPEVGSLSRHYSDEQLRQLDEAGRNLTREELMVKTDAYLSGRLGPRSPGPGPDEAMGAPTARWSPEGPPNVDGFDPNGVTRDTPSRPLTEGLPPDGFDPNGVTRDLPARPPAGASPEDGFDPNGVTRVGDPIDPFLPGGSRDLGIDPEMSPSSSSAIDSAPSSGLDRSMVDGSTTTVVPDGGTAIFPPGELPPANPTGEISRVRDGVPALSPAPAEPSPLTADPLKPAGAGGFGQSPGGYAGGPAARRSDLPRINRELKEVTDRSLDPHTGRATMDEIVELRRAAERERRLTQATEEEKFYWENNPNIRDTPEMNAELNRMRQEVDDQLARMDQAYDADKAVLQRDHQVLDQVERYLGSRTGEDYAVLDVERSRPNRVITQEDGLAGTLYNRFNRHSGNPLQGTPEQHRAALEASGVTESQTRQILRDWVDPTHSADSAAVDRAISRYLVWLGY